MNRFLFNLRARNAHGLHSPFVYELYTQIINPCLHQSGKLSALLASKLFNYQGKSLENIKFNVQMIDINQFDTKNFNVNFEDVLLIENIRKPNNLARWNQLIENEKIVFSIELYELGLLFFNPIAPKQHFVFKKS
jgi:hypothetical protein